MFAPADRLRSVLSELFEERYDRAVVYADADGETVLHEGRVCVRPSGWIELPTGRLLSPDAVHHVDVQPAPVE